MATELPKYVRLSPRLSRGCLVDLNSGFSISGLDVVETPDRKKSPLAGRFIKSKLNQGVLEPASKAEYEEVEETRESARNSFNKRLAYLAEIGGVADLVGMATWQESKIQDAADASRAKLSREEDDEEDEYEEVSYSRLTVKQLQNELDERELEYPSTANKAALVDLLETSDAEEEEEEDSSEDEDA